MEKQRSTEYRTAPDARQEDQVVAGRNPVIELLRSGRPVDKILIVRQQEGGGSLGRIVAMAKQAGIPVKDAAREKLDALCPGINHQGVAAFAAACSYCEVEELLARAGEEPPFLVIADGIEDPHNLGSILRVCECAGVHGVIIPKNRAASVTDTAVRTSAGASQYVKVARVANLSNAIATLKKAGLWVFCADMDGREITECNLKGPLALVIGGEDRGVSRLVKENCDGAVSIKMKGKINSLNASVACGVAVYEALRQRG